MGKKLGTLLVSNPSTYVEKIYFNTALTKDEVNALFLNNPSFTDNEVYSPFSVGDSNNYIQVVVYKEKGYVTINALVNGSIVGIFGSDGWRDTFSGVSSKYLEFNKYGVSEVNGSQIGNKNDLLRKLLSMNSDFKDTSSDVESLLYYVGSAIKTKKGSSAKINAQNYEEEILNLSGGGITPTGTKEITTNGTHDVTSYASVNVNVVSGGSGGSEDTLLNIMFEIYTINMDIDCSNVVFNNPDNIPIYKVDVSINPETEEITVGDLELYNGNLSFNYEGNCITSLTANETTGVITYYYVKLKDLADKTVPSLTGVSLTKSSASNCGAIYPTQVYVMSMFGLTNYQVSSYSFQYDNVTINDPVCISPSGITIKEKN